MQVLEASARKHLFRNLKHQYFTRNWVPTLLAIAFRPHRVVPCCLKPVPATDKFYKMFFVRLAKWLTGQICCLAVHRFFFFFYEFWKKSWHLFHMHTQSRGRKTRAERQSSHQPASPALCVCLRISPFERRRVYWLVCSLTHIMADRGVAQRHLSLTVRSPWTHSPQWRSIMLTSPGL